MFDFIASGHKRFEELRQRHVTADVRPIPTKPWQFLWRFGGVFFWTLFCSVTTLSDLYRGILSRRRTDARIAFWSNKLLKCMGVTCKLFGEQHLNYQPNRSYMILSNHESTCDVPALLATLPGSIRMLSRKEYFQVPVWGNAMRVSEFLSVDRKNREQAIKDLEYAKTKMESGIILWGAPEGTRSRTGKMLPFKKGLFMTALQMNAIIIPVGLRGAYEAWAPGSTTMYCGSEVEVHVGVPIDTTQYDLESRDQLMSVVESEIRQLSDG